jgi:hypothetical protein
MHRELRVLGKYVGHLVIGIAMFAALLLFVTATNLLVQWFAPFVSDPAFTRLMTVVEKVILHSDVLLLVWWTLFSTFKAIMELYRE